MARVHRLDPQTVEQIRAGEVIERPASVVKELVENAIDANAQAISVYISGGGINEITVQDDGEGLSAEDAELAVQHHTTSKLTNSADLYSLTTLGFRGEALASIGAVAHLELLSRTPEAEQGVRVKVSGGALTEISPAPAPQGTTITIRNLFFNTPPRRAFLKSLTAEGNQVDEVVTGLALSRPQIRFQLIWDKRTLLDVFPDDSVIARIKSALGKEWAQGLIPLIEAEANGGDSEIRVSGFISPPDRNSNTRTGQYLFVNGRFVKSQPVSFALSRGYGELLPTGRFPLAVLFFTVPPQSVDINVHPTKREVKFQNERAVLDVLVHRVRQTLDQSNEFKAMVLPAGPGTEPINPEVGEPLNRRRGEGARPEANLRAVPKPPTLESLLPGAAASTQPPLWRRQDGLEFRILGQSHELFVIVEIESELWIVDQHAAHERVMYEQVLTALHTKQGESQPLLLPVTFELSAAARIGLEEVQEYLTTLGFAIEPFGGSTYQVQATPPYFRPADTPDLIVELAQARAESRSENAIEAKLSDIAARIACKVKSVKAGQTLTPEAMKALVTSLLACQSPFVCPHGRPTVVRLPVQHLAAQFDRR